MKISKVLLSLVSMLFLTLGSCKCAKTETAQNKKEILISENMEIKNTKWKLVEINDINKQFRANSSKQNIFLNFSENTITTSDGCNTIGASFTTTNEKINFENFRSTRAYCGEDFMKKNGYNVPFNKVKSFTINNKQLFLFNENKTILATYSEIK